MPLNSVTMLARAIRIVTKWMSRRLSMASAATAKSREFIWRPKFTLMSTHPATGP